MTAEESNLVNEAVQCLAQALVFEVGSLKRISKKQREALHAAIRPVMTLPMRLKELQENR